MVRYIIRRILDFIPTMFCLITLVFFMMRIAPGGPFDDERCLSPEVEANLLRAYHMDEPLWMQYCRYVWQLLHGDMGPSYKYKDFKVVDIIASNYPTSLKLGCVALSVSCIIGITLGIVAAIHQNKNSDRMITGFSMIGVALPNYVIGPALTLIFAVYLRWIPVSGWESPVNFIMPMIALALPQIAYITRLMRASMLDILRSPFIRTAQAKGLSPARILLIHALKPAMFPLVSYLGPAAANVMTGSVAVEIMFGIPGLGKYFWQGAVNRDYTLVMGVVIFYGVLIIMFNLIVDILYVFLDPKVNHE